MTTDRELMAQGLCTLCRTNSTHHGPWTAQQIAEVAEDLGTPVDDASDWCDDCMVGNCFCHDVPWAQELLGRDLKLSEPRYLAQLHPPDSSEKQKASSANCQPLPETRSAPTEQTS